MKKVLLLIGLAVLLSPALAWKEQCENFGLPESASERSTLVAATYYAANSLVNLTSPLNSVTNSSLPAFCRLKLRLLTNAETGNFAVNEVWLPDAWNDRLAGFGGGGWSGGVSYENLAFVAVNRGFAGFSSNSGHNSSNADASWALGDPEAIIDFSYRAFHLGTIDAKRIVKAYYGRAHKTAIWSGCSTAGRQGLKAIQMYPDDYDSAIIGSPANWITHLQPWSIHVGDIIRPNTSDRWLGPLDWALVNEEVLKQCDQLDGVQDNIISYPYDCLKVLQLEKLSCGARQASGCLTPTQINAAKLVYRDYYEGDEFIFTSMLPGSELGFQRLLGPQPSSLSVSYFQNMVYNDTQWSAANYSVESIRLSDQINPGQQNALTPSLDVFKAKGGKVMMYVGLADTSISPGNSRRYYNSVADYYSDEVDNFFRLFEVPGMGHCSGGLGPTGFGASGQTASNNPPLEFTPEYDITSALLSWYEDGRIPDRLIGTSYNDDLSTNGVNFTRPLCAYPKKATYIGGNTKEASSFQCT